jgi:hypothetical protein
VGDAATVAPDDLEKPNGHGAMRHPAAPVTRLTTASPKAQVWWAFTVSLAVALVVAFSLGQHSFYYGDSASYWVLGLSFIQHGSFSFTNLQSPTWGYVYPLYDLFLHELAQTLGISSLTIIRIANCLVLAALATVALPRMAQNIWPNLSLNFLRRVLLAGLLLVFWRGWLNFSLTDFSGLLLLVTALSFLATSRSVPRYLLAGLFTALACNIRPSYLPVLIFMAMLMARNSFSVRNPENGSRGRRRLVAIEGRRTALCIGVFIVGLFVVSFPQALLNHTHYGTWSPVAGAPAKLAVGELDGGMVNQRFESVVVDNAAAGIVYPDPATAVLLQTLPGKAITGYGEYAKIVVEHPLVMMGGFGRRLVNGFDVHYSTPYTPHIVAPPDWLDLASCTLCFLALLRLLPRKSRKLLGRMDWIYLAGLGLLCVTALPVLVEPRFMLTGDVIAYVLLLAPGWRAMILDTDSRGTMRLRWPGIVMTAAAYVFWVAIWFAVIDATLVSFKSP